MEKVYAHRTSGLEANIIGCATYELNPPNFLGQFAEFFYQYVNISYHNYYCSNSLTRI